MVRYVPIHHLREPAEQQKIKLQELMSGIKEYPELYGLNIRNKHKYKRSESRKQSDPMIECKFHYNYPI